MFKSKAQEFAATEDLIKEEINEVKERLEILQTVKQRDRLKTQIEQQRLKDQIKLVEQEIESLLS